LSQNLVERLDPEIKGQVKAMMELPSPSFDDLPAARIALKKMAEKIRGKMPVFHGITTEDRSIPGPEGAPDITVRIYRPEKQSGLLPALLWIHGGGYMLGDLDQDDFYCKKLLTAGDCLVISVAYRLAPEYPYPAPIEDCYAALKWLSTHAGELKAERNRIAIGGASAGGGLAAGLALLARDRAEVGVIFQLLIYPMIDDCNIAQADDSNPETILWKRGDNLTGWRSYLGCEPGGKGVSCYAAASRADDLKGLPPAYITVGDLDLFAQENIDYAGRLVQAGISTELHVYPGGCHSFDMLAPNAGISRRFNADIQCALKKLYTAEQETNHPALLAQPDRLCRSGLPGIISRRGMIDAGMLPGVNLIKRRNEALHLFPQGFRFKHFNIIPES
jgi:acetyl esterase/lipase